MPLISKPNYNQIFASQAPEQDKPAVFNNYPSGWGTESRPNNGKPTIKGFNYLQQTSDLKDLWILQNGACLPYDESIEYAEGAPVLKDGVIQYKTANGFKSRDSVSIPTYSNAADGVDPVIGVANGAYFNVRSTGEDTVLVEYQNVGGVPTPSGKWYPSGAAVESIIKEVGAIKTPVSFNIPESETVNVTTILAQLLNPAGKHVMMLEKRVYLLDSLVVPANTILYANGAILKRRVSTGATLVRVQAGGVIVGAEVDGNVDALIGSVVRPDAGISLSDGAVAIFCKSHDNYGHGFNESNNSIVLGCVSYKNGRSNGSSGNTYGNFGDGFSHINNHNVQRLFCRAYENHRNGFTATTYDDVNGTAPDYQNASLSTGLKMIGCRAYDNGYVDNDIEGVSSPQMINCEANTNFTHTTNMNMANHTGYIYAENADFASIVGIKIPRSNASGAFYLSGKSPQISNMTVTGKEGVTQNGVAVEIQTTNGLGSLDGLIVDRAWNGLSTNLPNVSNYQRANLGNFTINYDGRAVIYNGFVKVEDGNIHYKATIANTPSSSTWVKGDMIYNTANDENYALVCASSGTATNTVWSSGNAIALNAVIYSGSNVYKATTAGTLGTTAPNHTSGTVENGTAQLQYVSSRAQFKYLGYKTGPILSTTAILPASITNINNLDTDTFYWMESQPTNAPLSTRGTFPKASIKTFKTYRTSGNNEVTQEVYFPSLNEKWSRFFDGGIGSWSQFTLSYTGYRAGSTANRPTNAPIGFPFFDTTLGKPICLKSVGVWVDSTGVTV